MKETNKQVSVFVFLTVRLSTVFHLLNVRTDSFKWRIVGDEYTLEECRAVSGAHNKTTNFKIYDASRA